MAIESSTDSVINGQSFQALIDLINIDGDSEIQLNSLVVITCIQTNSMELLSFQYNNNCREDKG